MGWRSLSVTAMLNFSSKANTSMPRKGSWGIIYLNWKLTVGLYMQWWKVLHIDSSWCTVLPMIESSRPAEPCPRKIPVRSGLHPRPDTEEPRSRVLPDPTAHECQPPTKNTDTVNPPTLPNHRDQGRGQLGFTGDRDMPPPPSTPGPAPERPIWRTGSPPSLQKRSPGVLSIRADQTEMHVNSRDLGLSLPQV